MSKWTVLVYMAGDNNLESDAKVDIGEMAKVGSSDDVNVIVQLDTEEQKTVRMRVDRGHTTTLKSMKGVNTGDPAVLADFVKWGTTTFPADRTALVVWNHGGGFEDIELDYDQMRRIGPRHVARQLRSSRAVFRKTHEALTSRSPSARAIAIDVGARDYLDNEELRHAVEQGLGAGKTLDLLGCDACLMSMLEIAYEMRGTAKVMVASEESEPGAGWQYTDVLAALVKNPKMDAAELGRTIVNAYAASYQAKNEGTTCAAIDLRATASLATAVSALGAALAARLPNDAATIALARAQTLTFEAVDTPDYADLVDFLDRVHTAFPSDAAITKAVKTTKDAAKKAILRAQSTGAKYVRSAHGLSIFLPQRGNNAYLTDYKKTLDFATDAGGWTRFLESFDAALSGKKPAKHDTHHHAKTNGKHANGSKSHQPRA